MDKPGLNDVLYNHFKRLRPYFSYMAKRKQGSMKSIISIAVRFVFALPLSKTESGKSTPRVVAKQMICHFVRLKATFVLTLDRSFGTGAYAE